MTDAYDSIEVRGVHLTLYRHEALSEAIRRAHDFYEAEILDELRERLGPQRTIVDAGANIGNHSAYWSRFVEHDRIIAFEPIPANFDLLTRNLADDPTATCVQAALSDVDDFTFMDIDAVNMGRSRIAPGGDVRVVTVTLDSLGLTDVTLFKIDTEGHERRVLAGARATIDRCHPVILVEIEGDMPVLEGYACTRSWPGSNYLWEWQG